MSDSAFEQSAIFKLVIENGFEEVQIGNRFGIFQNAPNYKQTPEACLKSFRRWNGERLLLVNDGCVVYRVSAYQRAWPQPELLCLQPNYYRWRVWFQPALMCLQSNHYRRHSQGRSAAFPYWPVSQQE